MTQKEKKDQIVKQTKDVYKYFTLRGNPKWSIFMWKDTHFVIRETWIIAKARTLPVPSLPWLKAWDPSLCQIQAKTDIHLNRCWFLENTLIQTHWHKTNLQLSAEAKGVPASRIQTRGGYKPEKVARAWCKSAHSHTTAVRNGRPPWLDQPYDRCRVRGSPGGCDCAMPWTGRR